MNKYELDGDHLVPHRHAAEWVDELGERGRIQKPRRTGITNIDQMLEAARAKLRRYSAGEAFEAVSKNGAILVDIRPEGQRALEGSIPGALVVERNVLEWRFDPASSARLPIAKDHDLEVIVFCSEGYTSSLAAAALQQLGLWAATDIVGGFHAWRDAGLPGVLPNSLS